MASPFPRRSRSAPCSSPTSAKTCRRQDMNAPLIGARVQRKEDYRFLTGTGQYTDDVALPRQTYAVFVRSPHAHARIKSIKVDKAKTAPGVLAVYTGEDLAAAKVG